MEGWSPRQEDPLGWGPRQEVPWRWVGVLGRSVPVGSVLFQGLVQLLVPVLVQSVFVSGELVCVCVVSFFFN